MNMDKKMKLISDSIWNMCMQQNIQQKYGTTIKNVKNEKKNKKQKTLQHIQCKNHNFNVFYTIKR